AYLDGRMLTTSSRRELGYRSDNNWNLRLNRCRSSHYQFYNNPVIHGLLPNVRKQSPAGRFVSGILRAIAPKQVFFVKDPAYLDCDMQDQNDHRYRRQVLQDYTQYRDFFCEVEWVLDPSIRTRLHH